MAKTPQWTVKEDPGGAGPLIVSSSAQPGSVGEAAVGGDALGRVAVEWRGHDQCVGVGVGPDRR